ncbi:MAG: GTP-binding protein [Anaerolineae bacterium]
MPSFSDLMKELPEDTQHSLRGVWASLSPAERDALQALFVGLPSERKLIRLLIDLSMTQVRFAFGNQSRVAIVGPANVGKSTLYNQFIRSKEDRAQVSALPGTTRVSQVADAGLFRVVDTPGADAVGEVGEAEKARALSAARGADFLVIVFDVVQGIKRTEQELFSELVALKKPYIVVLNKIDLVRREVDEAVRHAADALKLKPEQVIPIAAKEAKNLEKVLMGIALADPAIMAALGRAMPAYRWQLAWRSIISASSVAAVIALTPLPMIDFIPLVTTQSLMILGIARVYDYRITPARARELIASFGMGVLGRTLFQQLSKFGGVPGWMLSAAIASATTAAIGYASIIWFERGERLSSASLKTLTQTLTGVLLDSLRNLGTRKPGKRSLQDRITKALEESDLAGDRTTLDKAAAGDASPTLQDDDLPPWLERDDDRRN